MKTVKVFDDGRSQDVRLPKEYRSHEEELVANKIGDIMPNTNKWDLFMRAVDMFSDDYMSEGQNNAAKQNREESGCFVANRS